MSDETITRMSLEEAIRRKGEGQTDWKRLRREQEAGLEPEVDADEERIRLVPSQGRDAAFEAGHLGAH